jgi:hypothetical protein
MTPRNVKADMLAVLTGRPVERIPWVPRLDLWYRANRQAGTLPPGFADAPLEAILDELDAGTHAIIPEFQDEEQGDALLDRGIGLFNLSTMPCRTVLEGVTRRVSRDGERTVVAYDTPAGSLRTVVLYDEQMRRAGITLSHIEEHAIKSPADYAAVGYLFEHARVEPNFDGYRAFADRIGSRGLAAAFVCLAASPMQFIQRELMPMDRFCFEMHDHPAELARLAEQIDVYWQKMLTVAAECPAALFLLGGNYDAQLTWPPYFRESIAPWLKQFAGMLHDRGKYLLTHTDGENRGLLEAYCECDIDVADSICPAPMTSLNLAETREVFADSDITIMGGIPSVTLLEQTMDDNQFDAFLDPFFGEEIGRGDHLILGISDTTPPGAKFDRLCLLRDRIAAFGPVDELHRAGASRRG